MARGQNCTFEYVQNGIVEDISGVLVEGQNFLSPNSPLPGWSRLSGTPQYRNADNTINPAGSGSLSFWAEPTWGEMVFNTLNQGLVPGETYHISVDIRTGVNANDGEVKFVIINGNEPLTQYTGITALDPTEFCDTIVTSPYFGEEVFSITNLNANWTTYTQNFTVPLNPGVSLYSQLAIVLVEDTPNAAGHFGVGMDNISITDVVPLSVAFNVKSHQVCPGSCDGVISLDVSGGFGGFQYTYAGLDPSNNGSGSLIGNSGIISDLCPDTYEITITDAHGCSIDLSPITIEPSSCKDEGFRVLRDSYTGGRPFGGNYYADKDVHLWNGTYTLLPGTRWEMKSCGIEYNLQGEPDPNSFRKIYLHGNAELIVDKATITGFCNNAWYGIIMQSPTARVKILDGGNIENAYKGVSGSGERLEITGATFANNTYAISDCEVESNYIRKTNLVSNNQTMPYPYNDNLHFMEKGIQLISHDISVIEDNVIENVKDGMEVWIYGSNTLKNNSIYDIRRYGLQLYNESGNLISAETNHLELNANDNYPPTAGVQRVIGIHQFYVGWPVSDRLNVRFYKNTIIRSPGTGGTTPQSELIGIQDVARGSGNDAFYEENTIILQNNTNDNSIAIRSDRNQNYGQLNILKNVISSADVGLQLGNESSNSNNITYMINCNYFQYLDWGIETIGVQANGNPLDISRVKIGALDSPAANYWTGIPNYQKLKNNSIYPLEYYKANGENIAYPNFCCFQGAANGGYLFQTSLVPMINVCQP